MKTIFSVVSLAGLGLILSAGACFAQDKTKDNAAPAAESVVVKPAAVPDQKQLEDDFIKTMTGATFNGRWCLVEEGKLGPEKEEKYTITGVNKVGNDLWLVHARVQYGNKDVTVPVPVYVKWAGDTPVISITDLAIPGLGTYTARVAIYHGRYAGTWSGGRHEGMLHGIISSSKP